MNMIKSFNDTIEYIETVLDSKIDKNKVFQLSSYSFAMFSRLFSIITDMTLSEYIRYRKLTRAAIDLRETGLKVIDVALKYGYESADSFSNAFKKFHGYSPLEVKRGKQFRVFSPMQLAINVKGGRKMNVIIKRKEKFYVAGIKQENMDNALCPEIWDKLYSKYDETELEKFGSGQSYGMCYGIDNENKINYMACYDVKDTEKAKKMGLEVVEISEAEYAIFELKGAIPKCIHDGWKYAMEVFFPEHGYIHSGHPDFEVYSNGDMHSDNYKMQLWIPIEKNK